VECLDLWSASVLLVRGNWGTGQPGSLQRVGVYAGRVEEPNRLVLPRVERPLYHGADTVSQAPSREEEGCMKMRRD
jgi:hypothetical protein